MILKGHKLISLCASGDVPAVMAVQDRLWRMGTPHGVSNWATHNKPEAGTEKTSLTYVYSCPETYMATFAAAATELAGKRGVTMSIEYPAPPESVYDPEADQQASLG